MACCEMLDETSECEALTLIVVSLRGINQTFRVCKHDKVLHICFCSSLLTWTGVGPSQHAIHLVDGVLPAAGAGLHVWMQLVQPVTEVLVAIECQLRQLLGHHQLFQIILKNDHPDDIKGKRRKRMKINVYP